VYGEVLEVADGRVSFRPLCPAAGWHRSLALISARGELSAALQPLCVRAISGGSCAIRRRPHRPRPSDRTRVACAVGVLEQAPPRRPRGRR
jgi:hypothetical protein